MSILCSTVSNHLLAVSFESVHSLGYANGLRFSFVYGDMMWLECGWASHPATRLSKVGWHERETHVDHMGTLLSPCSPSTWAWMDCGFTLRALAMRKRKREESRLVPLDRDRKKRCVREGRCQVA